MTNSESTLLAALAGDLDCAKGSATIDGVEICSVSMADLAALRAVLPQQHRVSFGFTAEDIVRMGCLPHGGDPRVSARRAMERTDVVHLADRRF